MPTNTEYYFDVLVVLKYDPMKVCIKHLKAVIRDTFHFVPTLDQPGTIVIPVPVYDDGNINVEWELKDIKHTFKSIKTRIVRV